MTMIEIFAQVFGIFGMVCTISSFQCKKNSRLFFLQATSGLMFSINFFLLGAVSGGLFNAVNIARGTLLSKSDRVKWKLLVLFLMYAVCTVVSMPSVWGNPLQMVLMALTTISQFAGTASMWYGNGAIIRKVELFYSAPIWLIYSCFNFSLGGIVCQSLNIISIVVSFIRFGKKGFEK